MIALDDRLRAEVRRRELRHGLAIAITLALAGLAIAVFDCGNVSEVHADDRPAAAHERLHTTPSRADVLLGVLVAEEGLRLSPGHGGILEVLSRRGLLTAEGACRYSAAFDDECELEDAADASRPWLAHLDTSCEEPARWDLRAGPWERWDSRCRELVEALERYLAGELDVPLERGVVHFGAPYGRDLARAEGAGWRRVIVPNARTAFWAVR